MTEIPENVVADTPPGFTYPTTPNPVGNRTLRIEAARLAVALAVADMRQGLSSAPGEIEIATDRFYAYLRSGVWPPR